MTGNLHIRWLIRRDLREVLEIDWKCGHPDRWEEGDYRQLLRQRNCIGMVVEEGDTKNKILGVMVYALHRTSIDILRFGVHPDYRHRGVGTAMIEKLLGKLSHQRRTMVRYMVHECDLETQLFLRSRGFWARSVDRGVYGDWSGYLFVGTIHALNTEAGGITTSID